MATNEHNWVPNTYGHGETMCTKCGVTNREAVVLGMRMCERLGTANAHVGSKSNVLAFTPKPRRSSEGTAK